MTHEMAVAALYEGGRDRCWIGLHRDALDQPLAWVRRGGLSDVPLENHPDDMPVVEAVATADTTATGRARMLTIRRCVQMHSVIGYRVRLVGHTV